MKLNQLPGDVHLTYCTNIHAGESWQDIRASLDEYVPAIKSGVASNQSMGVGLRLSGQAAAVAREPDALASFGRGVEVHEMDEKIIGQSIDWLEQRK